MARRSNIIISLVRVRVNKYQCLKSTVFTLFSLLSNEITSTFSHDNLSHIFVVCGNQSTIQTCFLVKYPAFQLVLFTVFSFCCCSQSGERKISSEAFASWSGRENVEPKVKHIIAKSLSGQRGSQWRNQGFWMKPEYKVIQSIFKKVIHLSSVG